MGMKCNICCKNHNNNGEIIMTLEEAKTLYLKYNCSEFAMGREDWNKYNQFKALKIDDDILNQWKLERLNAYIEELEILGDLDTFGSIEGIFENIKSVESLKLVKRAIDLVDCSDDFSKVFVAESMLGRKSVSVRDGFIFAAHDLNEIQEAEFFLKKAEELFDSVVNKEQYKERINKGLKRLEIMKKVMFN